MVDTIIQTSPLAAIAIVIYFVYGLISSWLSKKAAKTSAAFDANILILFQTPDLLVLHLITFSFFRVNPV